MSKNRTIGGAGKGGGRATGTDAAAAQKVKVVDDPRYVQNLEDMKRRGISKPRIVGGTKVRRGEFLDCVAVGSARGWGCTGTLIGPNVVLTAGHCQDDDQPTRIFIGNDVNAAGLEVGVAQAVLHPEYAPHPDYDNDLMVLILSDRVRTVLPRRLATKAQIDAATGGRAVGFGHVDLEGTFGYGVKQMVDLPIASTNCRGRVNGTTDIAVYGCHRGVEIVAGRRKLGKDSCSGDSGGPFYISDGDGGWLLAGATSRATVDSTKPNDVRNVCGDGGVYVRVDSYRKWILSIPGVALT